ncbi:MAG: ABC transporter ATP-binding protein/permease [Oscillospiraceae bacterium]|nr:ABC transporter ATP-binding protein/permease [Oscillospiraceae bacterium]
MAVLEKSREIDAESYDDPEFYDMLSKAMTESDTRTEPLLQQLIEISRNIFAFAAVVSIILMLDPLLIAVSILGGVLGFFIEGRAQKWFFDANEELVPVNRRANYFKLLFVNRETMSDAKQYGTFGALILGKYSEALTEKHSITRGVNNGLAKFLIKLMPTSRVITILVPYGYTALRAVIGRIAISDMTALVTAYIGVSNAFALISGSLARLQGQSLYIERLKTVLEYVPQIENDTCGPTLGEIETIEFQDVSFRYPKTEGWALRNVNFKIERGQKFALVGINGAGKTTIVKLLMRFYDPDMGDIRVNKRSLRDYNIQSVRNAVTSVFQEFQSYSLPIDELVSCAQGDAIDAEKVADALKRVGLYDKVMESGGIHTEYSKYFDENGVVFSGGQIQKLIIARMLYKGSNVLIMDEPSSALDPESEYEINRDIAQAAQGKTVIMISHRLSTTKDADKIILIEGGEVREQGSHAELMAKDGRYAHLFSIQASEYAEAAPHPAL